MPRHLAVLVPGARLGARVPGRRRRTTRSSPRRAAYQAGGRAPTGRTIPPPSCATPGRPSGSAPTHGGVIYDLASRVRDDRRHGRRAGRPAPLRGAGLHRRRGRPIPTWRRCAALPASLRFAGGWRGTPQPLVRARAAFTLPERDLLTEGIAYDPGSRLVLRRQRASPQDPAGGPRRAGSPSSSPSGRDGLWAPMGMRVDPARARALGGGGGGAADGRLRGGRQSPERPLPLRLSHRRAHGRVIRSPRTERPHALGDLTISRHGRRVRQRQPGPGDLPGPGRAPTRSSGSSSRRCCSRRRDSRWIRTSAPCTWPTTPAASCGWTCRRARSRLLAAADTVLALGVDGLYRAGGDLVGIQNGVTPHRVVRSRLDPAGDRIDRLDGARAGAEGLCRADPRRPGGRASSTTWPTASGSALATTARIDAADEPPRAAGAPAPALTRFRRAH